MPKGKPAGEEKRWCCLCAYDGTDFAGWQKQPNRRAIQDKIEEVLKEIFGSRIRTIGSGRTDAGVHAKGQVFHFDALGHIQSSLCYKQCGSIFPKEFAPLNYDKFPAIFTRFIRQLERGTAIVHAKVGLNRKLIDLFYPSKKKNRT